MEGDISAARIANAICLDSSFRGVYLLVEGMRDLRLYKRFLSGPNIKVQVTWGKYKQREVYQTLVDRDFSNMVGIRDADFLRIRGNPKFAHAYSDAIFPTDHHDAEVMAFLGGVLSDYLTQVSHDDKVAAFEGKVGCTLSDCIVRLIYPLGCLRLANKRFDLGLSFKPEKVDGNRLKIQKFSVDTNWQYDAQRMINTVWEYSQNRQKIVASKAEMTQHLAAILAEQHPVNEIVNGHDLAAVLFHISVSGLKSNSKLLNDPGCVEDLLMAFYDLRKFSTTDLYSNVSKWSAVNEKPSVFGEP